MSNKKFFCDRIILYLLMPLTVLLMAGMSVPAHAAGGLFSMSSSFTEPTPAAGDNYGGSFNSGTVLSADGNTALVSAWMASVGSVSQAGKVFIYHYANNTWTLAKEIDDPDDAAQNRFGADIALNADGTVALIGNAAGGGGKAYLYTLTNGTWTQAHEFGDPAATAGDLFGYTGVALSATGQSAAICADHTTVNGQTGAGELYIYSESNGTWSGTAAFPDPDATANDNFCDTVAMSGAGTRVLAGSWAAVNGQSAAGKAYLYTVVNGTWTQTKEFDDPAAAAGDGFGGNFVSLSSDGQTAAMGAESTTVNGQAGAGEVYVYNDSNGTWTQAAAIPDPDGVANDGFGFPAQLSGSGTSLLIGSYAAVNGQSAAGKAYLYTLSNGTWVKTKEFDDPAAAANDFFGGSGVALSDDGETAFIGALGTTVNTLANAGEAYLYQSPDDISLALSANPGSVTTGQSVALDATVMNNDTAVTAYNVVLTDTLPAGLTYASSNAAGGTCSASGTTVTCTLTSLAPGATWQPTIMGSAGSTGSLSDTAAVTSNEPDPTTSNNNATASVTVSSPPPTPMPSSSGGGGGGALGLLSLFMLVLPLLRKRRHS